MVGMKSIFASVIASSLASSADAQKPVVVVPEPEIQPVSALLFDVPQGTNSTLPTIPKVEAKPQAPKVEAKQPAPKVETKPPAPKVEPKPLPSPPMPEPMGAPVLVPLPSTKPATEMKAEPIHDEVAKKEEVKSEEPKKEEDPALSAKWHHGLELSSKDKHFRVHVGGRYQFDTVWYDASDELQMGPGGVGLLQDGADFRRARVRIDGQMYDTFEWAMEYDFAAAVAGATTPSVNSIGFTDVWVEWTKIPAIGSLRIGNMKEPFSFEHLTSSRWLNFMERSTNFDPFADRFTAGFTPGVMLHNTYDCERGTWWLGVFRDTNVPFGFAVGDQHYAYDARVTYLPLWDECGNRFVHIGAAYSHRNLHNNQVRLRTRPSVRSSPGPLMPSLADTGVVAATLQDLANVEFVAVSGPWTFQSEYYASWVRDAETLGGIPLGTLQANGWYAELLLFLTGETREYSRKNASFDRVKPCQNLKWHSEDCECDEYCRSCGAWQVGARYSHTDLLDGGLGAVLDDWTLGLNWFMTPNIKVQWNYVATHRRGVVNDGWIHGFGMRTHIDF
jgi:phosphate-selective porin OprO and OprP